MTATTADDLRANVIGAWTPQSYEARSIDGSNTIYPLGVDPQGIIMYTRYGYMSAQLMSSGRAPFSDDDMHSPRRDELAAAAWIDPSIITKHESRYMRVDVDRGEFGLLLSAEVCLDPFAQRFARAVDI